MCISTRNTPICGRSIGMLKMGTPLYCSVLFIIVVVFGPKSSLSCGPSCSSSNCRWSSWSSWTSCSASCGNSGTQSRQRRVVQQASCGGSCHGSSWQSRQCNRFCYNGGSLQTYGCNCVVGYEGSCCQTRVTCPRLSAPTYGYIRNNGNTYGTTVSFSCQTGYELRGSSSRTCRSDHRWSGSQPSCHRITCSALPPLANGAATTGLYYGDTVTFSCNQGYELEGTTSLTCQLDKTWSGLMPRCIKITCQPDLPVPNNGSKTCSEGNRFQSTCIFSCQLGFRRVGPETRTCEHTGQWTNGTETWCEEIICFPLEKPAGGDVSPSVCTSQPVAAGSICTASCFTGFTLSGNPTAVCSYEGEWYPSVLDVNCTAITCNQLDPPPDVVVEPENCTLSEASFLDNCTFFCIPGYSHKNGPDVMETTCSTSPGQHNGGWTVPITDMDCEDSMDPVCQSCPEDVSVFSANREKAIDWNEPTWLDNSGNITDIYRSHDPGSLFYWGAPQLVYYIARDSAGNKGFCNFTVIVKQHACPYQAPPQNGAIACDTWLGGQFCSVSCNRDFDFAREPESLYYCRQEAEGGTWSPFLPGFHEFIFPWPDCTRRMQPAAAIGLQLQYYSFDCNVDTEEIRQNFITQMRQLNFLAQGFCMDADCNIDNVEVSCGTASTTRSKRQASSVINVDFDVVIIRKNNSDNTSSDDLTSHLENLVMNIQAGVAHGDFNISSGNITIVPIPDSFTEITGVVLRCSHGQVLKNSTCLGCPAGTYANSTVCKDCPMGFYQAKEAQEVCLPCPIGTTTHFPRGTSITQCREFCKQGTQFDRTTATCRNVSEASTTPAMDEVTYEQTDNNACNEIENCLLQGPAYFTKLSSEQQALLLGGALICVVMVTVGFVMALKCKKNRKISPYSIETEVQAETAKAKEVAA